MRTSKRSSFSSTSLARSLTDCRLAKSSFFTTTLPFPLSCRISSAARRALVRSLQARITLAPGKEVCEQKEANPIPPILTTAATTKGALILTSLGHIQGCLFSNASVGPSDEDCFPIQSDLTPTHSPCQPQTQTHYACSWGGKKKII